MHQDYKAMLPKLLKVAVVLCRGSNPAMSCCLLAGSDMHPVDIFNVLLALLEPKLHFA